MNNILFDIFPDNKFFFKKINNYLTIECLGLCNPYLFKENENILIKNNNDNNDNYLSKECLGLCNPYLFKQ